MGESTVVPGTWENGNISTALGSFAAPQGSKHIAIRPEHASLGGSLAAKVADVVYQGSFKRVVARPASAPEISLLARLPAEAALAVGDDIMLSIDTARIITLKD